MTEQLSTAHTMHLTKYTKEQLKYTKQILTDVKEKIDNDTIIVQFSSVTQSCPTLCDPMDCSPPGSSVLGDSSGKNTGVGCHAFLQGIFPTQGLDPDLLHCR